MAPKASRSLAFLFLLLRSESPPSTQVEQESLPFLNLSHSLGRIQEAFPSLRLVRTTLEIIHHRQFPVCLVACKSLHNAN